MLNKRIHNKKLIILSIINIILLTSIIFLSINYINKEEQNIIINKNIYTKDESYDQTKTYYQKINYKQYKKLLSSKEVYNIAIIDNSSLTYNKFTELINKLSYYKNSNIYLLEISKLSKKEEIQFYELDDRLKDLNSDYIISIYNNKVISITTYETENLNLIVDSINRGE